MQTESSEDRRFWWLYRLTVSAVGLGAAVACNKLGSAQILRNFPGTPLDGFDFLCSLSVIGYIFLIFATIRPRQKAEMILGALLILAYNVYLYFGVVSAGQAGLLSPIGLPVTYAAIIFFVNILGEFARSLSHRTSSRKKTRSLSQKTPPFG